MSSSAPTLSHLDEAGQVRMVDVIGKADSERVAVASAPERGGLRPADRARSQHRAVAAILAAKRCAELIPLCHSLPLSFVGVEFALDDEAHRVDILATCRTSYKTGVEMEAMTACSVAALTIYDMCKAADKGIVIEQVRLKYKAGGKSGEWRND